MQGHAHLALGHAVGAEDARELDLVLDGAVLVEVPEETVLVVGDLHPQAQQ